MSFLWHPQARLFAGDALRPGAPQSGALPDDPQSLCHLGAHDFRIGGPSVEPSGAPRGFETLTGGTSGHPRRIARTAASWQASFAVNQGLFGIGPGVRTAVLGRLVHSLALYGALESLSLGADLHVLSHLSPRAQGAALAGIDLLYATPAQLRLILEASGPELALRCLLVGGSKLDAGLRAAFRARAPVCTIHEFYGAAEASFVTLAGPDTPEASVGRPYPGVDLRIEEGEIWVKSPYLFTGYASDPGSARWVGDWLVLGETGWLQDGFLYLRGRLSRMVKVADQAAYPEEIEAFLMAQPGVTRAAVTATPDALRGARLIAHVMGTAPDAALLPALRQAFGPLKAPREIRRPATWPMLASGKTDLSAL
ncbi:AMP-binding protein [Rhodobacter sp. KR11]|uniref:AMP-binding protein n=1 Tax=Rhodobacter sp. KR11 TaxID=2974588 RepID=UPI00222293E8|nr:AMP-binding protein [Rhodobacter sp. KR11]MCW1920045.1 AMP-binding protein [Rhodobacter sp. KR11]